MRMALLLAFPSLSTLLMASVVNFDPGAALAAVSDIPCLHSVPTAPFGTYSSSNATSCFEYDGSMHRADDLRFPPPMSAPWMAMR